MKDPIDIFLEQPVFAVAGASTDRNKYGNKVVRVYKQNNCKVYPINPKAETVEELKAYKDVASLPSDAAAFSIVTPPAITLQVVRQGLKRGIEYFWMQPGAENAEAITEASDAGATVIHGGPCILVAMGYKEP